MNATINHEKTAKKLEALYNNVVNSLKTIDDLVEKLGDGKGIYFKKDCSFFVRAQHIQLSKDYFAEVFFDPCDGAGVFVYEYGNGKVHEFYTSGAPLQNAIRTAVGNVLPIFDAYSLDSYSSWIYEDCSNHDVETFTNVLEWGYTGRAFELNYEEIKEQLVQMEEEKETSDIEE